MFEGIVLDKLSGTEKKEVTRRLENLCCEELDVVRSITSRKMRWTGR
jgi:hypothetical protein